MHKTLDPHILQVLMLCIIYVRNAGRYGHLRIRPRQHRWPPMFTVTGRDEYAHAAAAAALFGTPFHATVFRAHAAKAGDWVRPSARTHGEEHSQWLRQRERSRPGNTRPKPPTSRSPLSVPRPTPTWSRTFAIWSAWARLPWINSTKTTPCSYLQWVSSKPC